MGFLKNIAAKTISRGVAFCDRLLAGRLEKLREDHWHAIYHRLLDLNQELFERRAGRPFDVSRFLSENGIRRLATEVSAETFAFTLRGFRELCENIDFFPVTRTEKGFSADGFLFWGIPVTQQSLLAVRMTRKPVLFVEGGLLCSVAMPPDATVPLKYRYCTSFLIDDISIYYNAGAPSRLEMLLDSDLEMTAEQRMRARKLIDRIVENNLSKYNHQPIVTPEYGAKNKPKVLVLDQRYGDQSILLGCADESTFQRMLEAAVEENPEADILVKTHPHSKVDQSRRVKTGYYAHLAPRGNIIPVREPINAISLIRYVDKLYVATSQFGYEALLCGKEVHVFGYPFYAGWGLTRDRLCSPRRTKKRSLEELFYITNILYAGYVNPETRKACEMEEIIDYLLEMRARFFEEFGVPHPIH